MLLRERPRADHWHTAHHGEAGARRLCLQLAVRPPTGGGQSGCDRAEREFHLRAHSGRNGVLRRRQWDHADRINDPLGADSARWPDDTVLRQPRCGQCDLCERTGGSRAGPPRSASVGALAGVRARIAHRRGASERAAQPPFPRTRAGVRVRTCTVHRCCARRRNRRTVASAGITCGGIRLTHPEPVCHRRSHAQCNLG